MTCPARCARPPRPRARARIERAIRSRDGLHEALAFGADPLHLALVFNLSHTTASCYAAIAQNLLDDQTGVRRGAIGRESGRS